VLALVSGGYESACIMPEDTWGRKPAPIFNSDFLSRKSETFCMTHVSKVGRRFSTRVSSVNLPTFANDELSV